MLHMLGLLMGIFTEIDPKRLALVFCQQTSVKYQCQILFVNPQTLHASAVKGDGICVFSCVSQ